MKSNPLLINSLDDAGRRLARIEATAHDTKNEAWLQELLYRHPELLPADKFNESLSSLIPLGREVPTKRGPIDNLYVSAEGVITLVETKLWKNPEKHRTVVAQIIDYAKEVANWDYDQLCEAILTSSRRREETEKASLEEKVAEALQEEDIPLHVFQENLAACLSEGSFLLLIVGDRISPNIALLTKAIQSAPGLGFSLGLVEMQLYEVDQGSDWPLIVVPEVVGQTVQHVRGVVQVRYKQEKPEVTVDIDQPDPDIDAPGLDRSSFLEAVPNDLRTTYEKGMKEWENHGGYLHITNKMIFWRMSNDSDASIRSPSPIRSRLDAVSVVSRTAFNRWFPYAPSALYEEYLGHLSDSSSATNVARNDKLWVKYSNLATKDLQIILEAGIWLANKIRDEDEA